MIAPAVRRYRSIVLPSTREDSMRLRFILWLAIYGLSLTTALGQLPPHRTFTKLTMPAEPVEFTCINDGDNENWLKDLQVEVENRSGRTILALECTLVIDDG